MSNFNSVTLLGRLTADPELRSTKDGTPVTTINLAINEYHGTGENKKEETLFIKVTIWKRTAEATAEYCKKGSTVLVSGRLKQEKWEKDGQKHSTVTVTAQTVQFIGGGKKEGNQPVTGNDPAQDNGDMPDGESLPF